MTLLEWFREKYGQDVDPEKPPHGSIAALARPAASSYQTIHKALRGEPIDNRDAATRISEATGRKVSVAELMQIFESQQSSDSAPPSA